jgi:hypothetical protein
LKNLKYKFMLLLKLQDGGSLYSYPTRPGSVYRKINNKWQIQNSSTQGEFMDIDDPSGVRSKNLNSFAKKIPTQSEKPSFSIVQPAASTGINKHARNNDLNVLLATKNPTNQRKDYLIGTGLYNENTLKRLSPDEIENLFERTYVEESQKRPAHLATVESIPKLDPKDILRNKITNLVRNPLVHLAYAGRNFASGTNLEVPNNYDELERTPGFKDETWDRNYFLRGANFASYFHPITGIAQGVNELPYTKAAIQTAYNDPTRDNIINATEKTFFNALDFAPGAYIATKTGRLRNPLEQILHHTHTAVQNTPLNSAVANLRANLMSRPSISYNDTFLGRILPKSVNPMSQLHNPAHTKFYNQLVSAGHSNDLNQATTSSFDQSLGSFSIRDIEELRHVYHNNERILSATERSLLETMGFGDANLYRPSFEDSVDQFLRTRPTIQEKRDY